MSQGLRFVQEIEALVDKYKSEGLSFIVNLTTRVEPQEAIEHFEALPCPDATEVVVGTSLSHGMSLLDEINAVSALHEHIYSRLEDDREELAC